MRSESCSTISGSTIEAAASARAEVPTAPDHRPVRWRGCAPASPQAPRFQPTADSAAPRAGAARRGQQHDAVAHAPVGNARRPGEDPAARAASPRRHIASRSEEMAPRGPGGRRLRGPFEQPRPPASVSAIGARSPRLPATRTTSAASGSEPPPPPADSDTAIVVRPASQRAQAPASHLAGLGLRSRRGCSRWHQRPRVGNRPGRPLIASPIRGRRRRAGPRSSRRAR